MFYFRFLWERWLSFTTSTWPMWMIASKTIHFFTRYVTSPSVAFSVMLNITILLIHIWNVFLRRLLRKLLKSFAIRVLLEVQVQNYLQPFVITSLRKVGVRSWVMKQLRRHLRRYFSIYCSFDVYLVLELWNSYDFKNTGSEVACLYLRQRFVCWIL